MESGMNRKSAGPRAVGPFRAAGKRTRVRRGLQIAWAAGLAVTACGPGAGCTAGAAPVAAGHPATTNAPAAAAPFVYVADKGNEISQFGSSPSGSGALRPLPPTTGAP